jgi:hypothetical protein
MKEAVVCARVIPGMIPYLRLTLDAPSGIGTTSQLAQKLMFDNSDLNLHFTQLH